MTLFLLVLLVLVGVVFSYRRSLPPKRFNATLCGLVTLIVIAVGVRWSRSRAPSGNPNVAGVVSRAVGFRLGQSIAQDIPAGSTILIMHAGLDVETVEAYAKGLRQGFGPAVYELRIAEPDLDGEEADLLSQPGLSMYLLRRYLERYPDAKAVVSLMGAPRAERTTGQPALPPLYVVGEEMEEVLPALIQRGTVRVAVVRRPDPDPAPLTRTDLPPEEVFERRFRLLRPETPGGGR